MEKLDVLFVRACKSSDPKIRLKSLYRRFYLNNENPTPHLVNILGNIVDKHIPMSAVTLMYELSPVNNWKYGEGAKFHDICLGVLITRIRLSKVDVFPGFVKPAQFRNAA
jgi:hypothetical protein